MINHCSDLLLFCFLLSSLTEIRVPFLLGAMLPNDQAAVFKRPANFLRPFGYDAGDQKITVRAHIFRKYRRQGDYNICYHVSQHEVIGSFYMFFQSLVPKNVSQINLES